MLKTFGLFLALKTLDLSIVKSLLTGEKAVLGNIDILLKLKTPSFVGSLIIDSELTLTSVSFF